MNDRRRKLEEPRFFMGLMTVLAIYIVACVIWWLL